MDIRKVRDYCLNPQHPTGRHKAHVFTSVLGLTTDHAEFLRNTLLDVVCNENAELTRQDEYGQRYLLDFEMTGITGSAVVRSTWIIRTQEDFPRLTSCYVRKG